MRRKNCGFAFVLYYNNARADYSRKKISSANFKMGGKFPTVTWADVKKSADNSASLQVISSLKMENSWWLIHEMEYHVY